MAKKLLITAALMLMLVCSLASCFGGTTEKPENADPSTHTHDFGEWETIKAATCAVEGSKERYCSCGEKQTSAITKTEHRFGEWVTVKNATLTETGLKEQSCSCGEKRTEVIEKLTITKKVTSSEWKRAFDLSRFDEFELGILETTGGDDWTMIIDGKCTFCVDTVYMNYDLVYNGEVETVNEYESCSKIEDFGDTAFGDTMRSLWDALSDNSDLGFLRFQYDEATGSYYANIDFSSATCKTNIYFENGNITKITLNSLAGSEKFIEAVYTYTYK